VEPSHTDENNPAVDLKQLSQFIYALNIARRQMIAYPAQHPSVEAAVDLAVQRFGGLGATLPEVTVGIARDTLLIGQGHLDRQNPVYRDMAGVLFGRGMATVTFHRELSRQELSRFLGLLCTPRDHIAAQGGVQAVLEREEIRHITVNRIDYAAFRITEEAQAQPLTTELAKSGGALWGRFVQGLLEGTLSPQGTRVIADEEIPPEKLAAFIKKNEARLGGRLKESYDKAISRFLSELDKDERAGQHDADSFNKIGFFVKYLSPELRSQFLQSTFENLPAQQTTAEKLLSSYPDEMILEALDDVSTRRSYLSPGVLNILQAFSRNRQTPATEEPSTLLTTLTERELGQRLRVIFREDEPDSFLPSGYQQTLRRLAQDEVASVLEENELHAIHAEISALTIESRMSEIILEIMEKLSDDYDPETMQRHLFDLYAFFRDTSDFRSLTLMHTELSRRCSGPSMGLMPVHEALLGAFADPASVAAVLDELDVWGKDRFAEIGELVTSVGKPFVEPILERLATESRMALRRFYIDCLSGIGEAAIDGVAARLRDPRWFMVRNMVVVLRAMKNPAVATHLRRVARHPHHRVRHEVIKALLELRTSDAEEVLCRELTDADPESQMLAIQLAVIHPGPAVLTRLAELVGGVSVKAPVEVRCAAVRALGDIADPTVLPALERLMGQRTLLLSLPLKRIKEEILQTLDRYPNGSVGAILRAAERGGVELARQAAITRVRMKRKSP